MFRIASVKFKKALSSGTRAAAPRVLAFCVMAVSLVFTLAVTAANLRLTYVTDSYGARQLVVSADSDPARVMSLSGIEAEEGDHVYYTAFSGSLASLNIERAFTVTIQADGQEYPVKLAFGTVADALERAGITLDADDYTEPALDQLVTAGSNIVVHRVDYQDKVETQAIPYDTQYVYTSLYFRNTGRATTLQHGAEGQQAVTTRERWVDGELENSTVVDVTTTVEPTDHVVKTYGVGAPVSPLTGADGTTNAPASYSKVLTVIIPRPARARRVWVWATAPLPWTPMSSPMAPCCISLPPMAVSFTVTPSPPTPASPSRRARSSWICSTRPMPSRSSTGPFRSMSTL